MSLRARIAVPEETGAGREDGHLVASYRAKLLEEIDLAEMSSSPPPSAGPAWSGCSGTSSAARARCSPPPSEPS